MSKESVEARLRFIRSYLKATNAATGSEVDSNANVTSKNVATMCAEIPKKDMIELNRAIVKEYLEKMGHAELIPWFEEDLKKHRIYSHDETSIYPYCVAVSLYPYLLDGLKPLGGTSGAPQHAEAFIGGLVNLIFLIAGQFAGAVAAPETLPYLDHFLRVDYGEDYTEHLDEVIEAFGNRKCTLRKRIENLFQQFVYCINQPAGARGYQSPFTNIAYFDRGYFEAIFKDFVFPDGDEPNYESTFVLQKMFMSWFNQERTKAVLTFPVETANLLYDENTQFVDSDMVDWCCYMLAQGHSFFIYNSGSADALSSCCRLKNGIENNVFSYTLGAGGLRTGSKKVITLNLNRLTQDWDREGRKQPLEEYIGIVVKRVHIYLRAWNDWLKDLYEAGVLTVYSAGYIALEDQYLTVGLNGLLEAAEYLKIAPKANNEEYATFVDTILSKIKQLNIEDRGEGIKYNSEMVPAENAAVKLYNWDKRDGYWVPKTRNLYNSYFYPVEDTTYSVLDKIKLHGNKFIKNLDGGSALHINLDAHLSKEQYRRLLDIEAKEGCSYLTYNIPNTCCNDCSHIDKRYLKACPECSSTNIDWATRIIGYLKRISNFTEARQEEASRRYYAPGGSEVKMNDQTR